nr:MAG TPA: hypothetical protein [Caudoviricetes sp.]
MCGGVYGLGFGLGKNDGNGGGSGKTGGAVSCMYSYIQLPHAFASRAFPIHWEGWEKNGVPLCTNRISNFSKIPC